MCLQVLTVRFSVELKTITMKSCERNKTIAFQELKKNTKVNDLNKILKSVFNALKNGASLHSNL